MKSACVVIPFHSSNPSEEELISFRRCVEILSNFDIFLVLPEGISADIFLDESSSVFLKRVNPRWLSSLKEYNKMKIDPAFYKEFRGYRYMLTYELDSYVFSDVLDEWCERGYDYIGAPWFGVTSYLSVKKKITVGGNSGFSLRNIQNSLKVLEDLKTIRFFAKTADWFPLRYCFRLISFTLAKILKRKYAGLEIFRAYLEHEYVHEDVFWADFIPSMYPFFKLSTFEESLRFSFEKQPEVCYEMNGGNLPFGCHAWNKYNPEFWRKYISG